ncbi:AIG2-like induced family protein [Perilla frutescens var. hirtella]|nr:AIG2-like induced family protein [Perilla frutescens var. hirtella]
MEGFEIYSSNKKGNGDEASIFIFLRNQRSLHLAFIAFLHFFFIVFIGKVYATSWVLLLRLCFSDQAQSFTAMAMAGGGDGSSGGDDARLIFVYGTLKRNFPNHAALGTGGAAYLGPCTTVEAFPLVCGPHGIPYLINLPGSGHRVRGELYSVSSVQGLDKLEGVEQGHYERLPVAVAAEGGGESAAEAYFAHRGFGERLWKRCGEVGLSEYGVEMGEKYVRREDRPLDYSFIHDINKFISSTDT